MKTYQQAPVRAMQFRLGETTKSEIVSFCPEANVGIGSSNGKMVETDIHWCAIFQRGVDVTVYVYDGDWIIRDRLGEYSKMEAYEFAMTYEEIK